MPESLSLPLFAGQVKSRFWVPLRESQGVELELVEAKDLGSTPRQEQFSLLFRGPLEPFLPQHIYQVQHDQLGDLTLFLVPVAGEPYGFTYEAVFSRLV